MEASLPEACTNVPSIAPVVHLEDCGVQEM